MLCKPMAGKQRPQAKYYMVGFQVGNVSLSSIPTRVPFQKGTKVFTLQAGVHANMASGNNPLNWQGPFCPVQCSLASSAEWWIESEGQGAEESWILNFKVDVLRMGDAVSFSTILIIRLLTFMSGT